MAASFVILRCGKRTDKEGGVLELVGDDFTLGRADTCAVHVDSDIVSRRHASLHLVDQGWMIADLDSSNGTFVNAERIATAEVRVGDKLMLGEAGPVYEVIALQSGGAGAELDSTRFLRVAKRKQLDDAHPAEPKPRPVPPPLVLEDEEPAPVRAKPRRIKPKKPVARPSSPSRRKAGSAAEPPRRRGFPYLAAAGIVLGVLVGRMWLGREFPYYWEFAAPGWWMVRGMLELEWAIVVQKTTWSLSISLAFYYMLVGFALQRPVKRFPFLVFLGLCHGAAIYFIRNL